MQVSVSGQILCCLYLFVEFFTLNPRSYDLFSLVVVVVVVV